MKSEGGRERGREGERSTKIKGISRPKASERASDRVLTKIMILIPLNRFQKARRTGPRNLAQIVCGTTCKPAFLRTSIIFAKFLLRSATSRLKTVAKSFLSKWIALWFYGLPVSTDAATILVTSVMPFISPSIVFRPSDHSRREKWETCCGCFRNKSAFCFGKLPSQ